MTNTHLVILQIDDDQDDIDMFADAINRIDESIEFVAALCGSEALDLLENHDFHPDIIFLDHNMPGMTGKEVLLELRKLSNLKGVPIIMHSTYFSAADMEYFNSENAPTLLKQTRFDDTVDKIAESIKIASPITRSQSSSSYL